MIYTEKAKSMIMDYFTNNDALRQQETQLHEQVNGKRITPTVFHENISEIQKKRAAMQRDLSDNLDGLQAEYSMAVTAWGALDGSKITDDLKLLTDSFKLTEDDLTALSEKHKGNVTMQRIIHEYASKHDIFYTPSTPAPVRKIAAFAALCDNFRSASRDTDNPFTRKFVEDYTAPEALMDHGECPEPAEPVKIMSEAERLFRESFN